MTGSWWCRTCCRATSSAATGRRWTRRWPDAAVTTRAPWTRSRSTSRASSSARTSGRTRPGVRPLSFHPTLGEHGGPPARRRRRTALARPGALQGGGRPRDRPAPGPPVLAHRRDRHADGVDPLRRLHPRQWRHGLSPRQPPARAARVRQYLHGDRQRPTRIRWPGRSSRASSRCSSRSRPARSPSTTA